MTKKTQHELTREALEYAASCLENDDFDGIWPGAFYETEDDEARLHKAQAAAVKRIRALSAPRKAR